VKTVTTYEDGTPTQVKVNVTDKAYAFPDGHARWTSPTTKEVFHVLPVTYYDVETTDAERTLSDLAKASGLSIDDYVKGVNQGIRLRIGDIAKQPFRKATGGKATQAEMIAWFAKATPEQMAAFKAFATTDEQLRYVKEQMAE
jgi:hypothetical protein